jgi:hypothetical protein
MSESNPPMKEFRAGTIVAAIWVESTPSNGRATPSYSIRIQKRYRDDRDGQWKTTSYLRPDELPKLALVVSRAYEFLTLRETEEPAASQSS